jgi:hypothetical protein
MRPVPTSRAGRRTKTDVVQLEDSPLASAAEQLTEVVPPLNKLPDGGVQLSVTGATPPVVVGELKLTDTGLPSTDCASTLAGQVTVSWGIGGGGGSVGPPQLPAPTRAATASVRPATRRRASGISALE